VVALIGAAAVIAAGITAALITAHPWSNGGLQLSISSVSEPVVNGSRVIEVTGTVANLGAGEYVYAFAGREANVPPWYPGGPAAISGGGLWTAEITGLPASAAGLSIWAGVASPPPASGVCAGACSAAGQFAELRELAAELAASGPHAASVRLVTSAYRGARPGG
jgi:hypothetical protein